MRFTVILVPEPEGRISALIPAMPGCFSMGRDRAEVLANTQHAMMAWLEAETDAGREPLAESPSLILEGVSEAMKIIDDMRVAAEENTGPGYDLELASVETLRHALA